MSVMRRGTADGFWDRWGERFITNRNQYITPFHPQVENTVDDVEFSDCCVEWLRVIDMWEWVNNNINYKLSKEWKEPSQTLTEASGDCEDLDFLLASMMLNDGIENFEYVIGYLIHDDGTKEEHTWLRMDDLVIEPTALPEQMDGLKYQEVKSFIMKMER